jgi:hypothetical protein
VKRIAHAVVGLALYLAVVAFEHLVNKRRT